jgi:hypothetical protein
MIREKNKNGIRHYYGAMDKSGAVTIDRGPFGCECLSKAKYWHD